MRKRWAALVLVAGASALAGEEAAKADLRTPTRWAAGEIVSAAVVESTDTTMTLKREDGSELPGMSPSTKLTAKFVERCVEVDADRRLVRSVVRIDAWEMRRTADSDHCLEGALLDVGPDGWTLVTTRWNPSRAARGWLNTRFGGSKARGFSGGLAELGSAGPVAAGDSWTAEPPAIAHQLAAGNLPLPLPERPWKFTVAEVAATPLGLPFPPGPPTKVTFDETFAISGDSRAGGRVLHVAEGSSVHAHGSFSGAPGAWHRSGRMDVVAESDVQSSSSGVEIRILAIGRETEAWDAGGKAPEMPKVPPRAVGRNETWKKGDAFIETGTDHVVTVTTPYDLAQKAGESWSKETKIAWTAEIECAEADARGRPEAFTVTFRQWSAAFDGVQDDALAGAVLRVSADDIAFVRGGADVGDATTQWLRGHFGGGGGGDDAVRAAVTPVMLVAPKQGWWSDPVTTVAALRARITYPIEQDGLTGTGTLVAFTGEGDAARADMEYSVDAGIACAPGCMGAGAALMKGKITVRGTASGPVSTWSRLGAYEDETDVAVTVPGLSSDESMRRLAITQKRGATRRPLSPQALAARKLTAAANDKMKKRDFDGVIEDATNAIAADPGNAQAWYVRGRARASKGDDAGGLADYTKAIETDPTYAEAYATRAAMRENGGDFDGAIADCDKAIELSPRLAVAYFNRAIARKSKDDSDGAMEDYTKAIELSPRYSAAYNNRGILHYDRDEFDLAIDDYTKSLEIRPKDAQTVMNRGNAKAAKKDFDGAIEDCLRAIELDPKEARAHYNLGLAREGKGDLDGAIAEFGKAIELDPKDASAWSNRAGAKAQLEDLEGAIADWRKSIELDARRASPHMNLARAIFRPALPAAPVIEGIRRAIAVDDDPDDDHLWLWMARARAGEEAAASKELTEYLAKRKPKGDDAWYPVLAGLLAGTVTEDAALATTKTADDKTTRERLCEAAFYAGMRRALHGDVPGAVPLLDRSIATDVRNYTEFQEAQRWRRALLEKAATPTK